jgi:protein involved in polysaccharide export with SLBB domain
MRGAEVPFADTVTVRAGRVITIGTLPEISLRGVLRSELQSHLTREIGRYVRDPKVTATSWVRVSVLGAIGQQGFYAFPADILLTDALMRAGGMREDTNLDKIKIKRGGREVVSEEEARLAIREGRTLDQLDVRAGDEITVGNKRNVNWQTVLRTVSIGVSLIFLVVRLSNIGD